MGILIETVRIKGFRGLDNIEVKLGEITILTGMNNAGKTSFLKALQVSLGNKMFINQDDFHISGNTTNDKIIIDIKIVPVDEKFETISEFDENWELLFTEERMRQDENDNWIVPLRTIITYNSLKSTFKSEQFILNEWSVFENEQGELWYDSDDGNKKSLSIEELSFFYIDAQRDILEDLKSKSSYLGKMISKIEYDEAELEEIEEQIRNLNEEVVVKSEILKNIRSTLQELNSTMNTSEDGIEITPFTKKVRDLNKGLSIYYTDNKESFSMESHGMGTRSWSSLLTLKSFINFLCQKSEDEDVPFFPVLAIEEPEAHLHPNAQKRLYTQINSVGGQKIISTHSPYIVASGEISELRSFYKLDSKSICGYVDVSQMTEEDLRKIERQVIHTRGELFFSKAIVFFEGDTEEQALPIFGESFFDNSLLELGIDFVGVGGSGNYLPFIRIAEALNIPWFILSDGENQTIKAVRKAIKNLRNVPIDEVNLDEIENIFVLENEKDFEGALIEEGYIDEIKLALEKLHSADYLENYIQTRNGSTSKRIKSNEVCSTCNQNIYNDILRNYTGDEGFKAALYDCMTDQKTQFGPVIADVIVESDKEIPSKILELFEYVKVKLNLN